MFWPPVTETDDQLHPLAERDLRDAKNVPLHSWLEGILQLPTDKLRNWAARIGELKWFEDADIQDALIEYCRADRERERYDSFITMANRVLDLARGNIPGIHKTRSYPIQGVRFVDYAGEAVEVTPEYGKLGAELGLNVLCLPGPAVQKYRRGNRVTWTDILHWWELTFGHRIIDKLDVERRSRGMSPLDLNTGLPMPIRKDNRKQQRQGRTSNKRQLRASRAHISQSVKASSSQSTQIGTKRPPEDDLLRSFRALDKGAMPDYEDPEYDPGKRGYGAARSVAYALEMSSCTYGTRISCFGVTLQDDKLSFWYYDAAGIVYTEQYLSLVEDFEKTAAIIIGLACCTPEQLGALPASVVKPPVPYPRSFLPPNLTNNVVSTRHPVNGRGIVVKLNEPLFVQYTLTGRRTFAYAIETTPRISKGGLMARFAYQVNAQDSEQNLVRVARQAGIRHLPKVHTCDDLWKMSEGIREVFLEKDSTGVEYENRILRMIIYTRYASIKTLFAKRCELIPVMVEQMIDCLHDLRYKANMLHGGICVDSIMFEMRRDQYWFILIDFDMAVELAEDGSSDVASSRVRTGILPFMAHELIHDAWIATWHKDWNPIQHRLRYDFESLFWVSLWCVVVLLADILTEDADRELDLELARSWGIGDLQTIAACKQSLCTSCLIPPRVIFPEPAKPLKRWFWGWTDVLRDVDTATKNHDSHVTKARRAKVLLEPYDDETAGGTINRDILKKVLTPVMPFRQTDIASDELVADEDEDEALEEHDAVEQPTLKVGKLRGQRRKVSPEAAEAAKAYIVAKLRPRRKLVHPAHITLVDHVDDPENLEK